MQRALTIFLHTPAKIELILATYKAVDNTSEYVDTIAVPAPIPTKSSPHTVSQRVLLQKQYHS